MNYEIIGFCGKMGSGKTTLAEYLFEIGKVDSIECLADAVKYVSYIIFGIDAWKEDKALYEREIYQYVGSVMRKFDPDVWIKKLKRGMEEYDKLTLIFEKTKMRYAIPDVRYLNEAKWIVENGHLLVILTCSDKIRKERIKNRDFKNAELDDETWEKINSHESEQDIEVILKQYSGHDNVIVVSQINNDIDENKIRLNYALKRYYLKKGENFDF